MIQQPIIELDVHGKTAEEAVGIIEACVQRANSSTYRIRVIHGFNRGNMIQKSIYRELGYGLCPKIRRIVGGDNPGITELVLKEF